ncbi:hypothetical protein BBP40_011093 [Aspergillus hancockii]|nr:hypothetical protein BBP40_011093 [Aspergillus hancockii]
MATCGAPDEGEPNLQSLPLPKLWVYDRIPAWTDNVTSAFCAIQSACEDSSDRSEGRGVYLAKQVIKHKGLQGPMEGIAASLTKMSLDLDDLDCFRVCLYLQGHWAGTKRREAQLWKSSVLAIVYHGLDQAIQRHINDSASHMERKAQLLRVLLKESETGKEMALHLE